MVGKRARARQRQVPLGASCHYCGEPATTKDHVMPASVGGKNALANLVPSCGPCNWNRGAKVTSCRCDLCVLAIKIHRRKYRSDPRQWRGMMKHFRAFGITVAEDIAKVP